MHPNDNSPSFGPETNRGTSAAHSALEGAVAELLLQLISILEIAEPYTMGISRLTLTSHLILLRSVRTGAASRSTTNAQQQTEVGRLHSVLVFIANELKGIEPLLHRLLPKIPTLSEAFWRISEMIEIFQSAIQAVRRLESSQQQTYNWGSSLVGAVNLLGEVFCSSKAATTWLPFHLQLWRKESADSSGTICRWTALEVHVGAVRKAFLDGGAAFVVGPSGGITEA